MLAVISDPAGAVFCAWEREGREGAELINEPGAWSMSALHTGDPAGADAFYAALFGWEAEPFGPPEANIALYRLPGYVGGEPSQPVPRDVVAVRMPPSRARAALAPGLLGRRRRGRRRAGRRAGRHRGGRRRTTPPPFKQAVLADPQGGSFSISQLIAP